MNLEQELIDLKKRVAALEGQVQAQQKQEKEIINSLKSVSTFRDTLSKAPSDKVL